MLQRYHQVTWNLIWFPVLTRDTLVDLLCRGWSSGFTRITFVFIKVFRKVFKFSFLHWGIGLISCNCFQIKGSFVDAAFFFRKSLLCISRNSSLVIKGDRLFLTLFVLNGACLSITLANRCFQKSHISFRLLCVVTRFQSIMRRSPKNSASLKFLSCRTSILEHIIFNMLEPRWVTLRIRKIAEWSLIPMLLLCAW